MGTQKRLYFFLWGQKKAVHGVGSKNPTFLNSFFPSNFYYNICGKQPQKIILERRIYINNTLNFLGFKESLFESFSIEENDKEIIAYAKLKRDSKQACKYCKSCNIKIKDYKKKIINHKHFTGKKCFIHYQQRRYVCADCKKTFYEPNPFSYSNESLSLETIIFILEELQNVQSFKSVALRTGLSESTIIKVFDEYVDIPREPMPKILGIDEFHYKSTGDEKYACILINNSIDHPSIVDIIKDRKKDTLSYYFQYIDKKERENVNFFVSDMYDGYKYVHDTWFPNSIHIIDTFHFIRLFIDALNVIRIKTMKKFPKDSLEYYILKKYYFILTMQKSKFKKDKIFYRSFNRDMNYYDLLNVVLNVDNDLRQAYFVKDNFCCNYWKYTYLESFAFIDNEIAILNNSPFEEYKAVANSLKKWRQEICNSYMLVCDKRITNARTEGFNNLVKVIKRSGYGYTNFKRFRNRILHIQKKGFKLKNL